MWGFLAKLFKRTAAIATQKPDAKPSGIVLSDDDAQWIVELETGGPEYYAMKLGRPSWPGEASGVTIGVGYDCGYNSPAEIRRDWGKHISRDALESLGSTSGIRGTAAYSRAWDLQWIKIPLDTAIKVFQNRTLPRFVSMTSQAYPGAELLPPGTRAALVSLVFNRGTGMSGARRAEMRSIQMLVCDYAKPGATDAQRWEIIKKIASQFRRMKRIWPHSQGLQNRREKEARRVESDLE